MTTVAAASGAKVADIPLTMTAIDPAAAGGPEVLRAVERPVPMPGSDEVLIRVHAAGVNRPDVLQRKGGYPPPPGAPTILGLEIAGDVVAVGDGVLPELLGQPMCALVSGGGYAQYCVAPVGQCLPVPPALTMVEAAALPETLFTVWTNLFERAYAMEGDTVLVHGGTSGIGTMAILLGKLFGLTVIVTCGSDEKCRSALNIGAAFAINYRTHDYVAQVSRITGGAGCAAVLDMVGGDYLPRNLLCLAEDGRHVSIATLGGAKAEVFVPMVMQPPPHADRIDAAPALAVVQDAGRRRDRTHGLAACRGGAVETGDGPRVSAGRRGGGTRTDGRWRTCREDRACDDERLSKRLDLAAFALPTFTRQVR